MKFVLPGFRLQIINKFTDVVFKMSSTDKLEQAIQLRQQIIDAIDLSDLDLMTTQQQKWQSLIDSFFQEYEDKDEKQISLLKDLNDDILQHLTSMQSQLSAQQSNLRKSRKASNAYLETASK